MFGKYKIDSTFGQCNRRMYYRLKNNVIIRCAYYDDYYCFLVLGVDLKVIIRTKDNVIVDDRPYYGAELFVVACYIISDAFFYEHILNVDPKCVLRNDLTFEDIYNTIFSYELYNLNPYEVKECNDFYLSVNEIPFDNHYSCNFVVGDYLVNQSFLKDIIDSSVSNKFNIYKSSLNDADYKTICLLENRRNYKGVLISNKVFFDVLLLQRNKIIKYKDTIYENILEEIEFKFEIIDNKLKMFSDNYISHFNEIIFFKEGKTYYATMSDLGYSVFEHIDKLDISVNKNLFNRLIYSKQPDLFLNNIDIDTTFKINSYFNYDDVITLKTEILENNCNISIEDLDIEQKSIYDEYVNVLKEINCFNNEITLLKDIVMFQKTNLSILKCFGDVNVSSNLLDIRVKRASKMQVSTRLEGGLLSFDFVSDMSNEEISEIIKAYHNKVLYVKLKNDTIIEIDESVEEIIEIVDDYQLDLKKELKEVKKNISFAFKTSSNSNKEIYKIVNEVLNYKDIKIENDDGLREYQKDGVRWLTALTKHRLGGILADDMGLGKTVQILTLIKNDKDLKPSIIVCPKSLIFNWINEIEKWNIGYEAIAISDSQSIRKELISNILEKVIYVTSYDTLARDINYYNSLFRFVVIDEAQYIKNTNTRKSKAVKMLNADIKVALTGTPIENSLSDLWSIFDFILPGYLSSYDYFKNTYEKLILNKNEEALKRFKNKINPFILRRVKTNVLKELPDKLEEIYHTNLDKEQKLLYDAFANKLRNDLIKSGNKIDMLATLTRLRQICVSPAMYLEDYNKITPKIEITIDIIKKAILSNHSILLFSQFVKGLNIIEEELKSNNIKFYRIDGSTNLNNRREYVTNFNNDSENVVFLISLKAGGVGLNLTKADVVIHLDSWWNVSAEEQANDRAHRIGQKNVVTVIKIVCLNTIEEKIIELQNVKKDLANKVLSNEAMESTLTVDDIKYLIE